MELALAIQEHEGREEEEEEKEDDEEEALEVSGQKGRLQWGCRSTAQGARLGSNHWAPLPTWSRERTQASKLPKALPCHKRTQAAGLGRAGRALTPPPCQAERQLQGLDEAQFGAALRDIDADVPRTHRHRTFFQ